MKKLEELQRENYERRVRKSAIVCSKGHELKRLDQAVARMAEKKDLFG